MLPMTSCLQASVTSTAGAWEELAGSTGGGTSKELTSTGQKRATSRDPAGQKPPLDSALTVFKHLNPINFLDSGPQK